MANITLQYKPQARQALMHNAACQQILYGGAAMGGKSCCLRWDAIMLCLNNAGLEAYLFRRTYSELEDNHIRPLLRELPNSVAVYRQTQNIFEFFNGSRIVLCHCKDTYDYLKYMGAEMHALYVDEASLFETVQLIEFRGRVRLGSFADKVNPKDRPFLPRCVFASNPGGPSHNFLQRTFISPAPEGTIFFDKTLKDPSDPAHEGWTTIFIRAKMTDNKFTDQNYGAVLSAMSPERARALREGDWSAVEGAALDQLDKQRHMVRGFEPPKHWTIFSSLDWGTAHPFSVGWYCVVGEDTYVEENEHIRKPKSNPTRSIFLPKNAVVRFNEYYGFTGRENEGVRKPSKVVAKEILQREKELKIRRPDYRIADSAMWAQHDAISPAESMYEATDGLVSLSRCRKDRIANYDELQGRLAGNPHVKKDGKKEEHPLFFISSNCVQAWRTLPTLLLDKTEPDKGPSSSGEDHIYDEIVYALASRPLTVSKEDYEEEQLITAQKAVRKSTDAYATS